MFPSTSSRETLRLSGKQNSLFPSGAHIKCILLRNIKKVFKPIFAGVLVIKEMMMHFGLHTVRLVTSGDFRRLQYFA